MKKFILSILLLFFCGCANMDKGWTEFKPVGECEPNYRCFEYKTTPNMNGVPSNEKDAENYRMEILKLWLKDNGYEDCQYEIVSREPVVCNKGVFGEAYDIYYKIKIKNNKTGEISAYQ